jgi:hypothetical protein
MRKDNLLVWDDFIPANATIYETSSAFDDKLGKYDQLALFAVLLDVVAPATSPAHFYGWIVHSGDGETFVQKNGTSTADAELKVSWTGTPAAALVASGSDPNTNVNPPTPFLKYVRLQFTMSGSAKPVRVRVYATQRDQGG